MALFMKQDFNPPILSKRWIAFKFRPNMVLYSRRHIIAILESGLMFREDSLEVEQEAPSPDEVRIAAGGKGWMTSGEKIAAIIGVAACVMAFPPKSIQRSTLLNLTAYSSIPLLIRWAHRAQCVGSLTSLLKLMRDYLALARRTAACLKEFQALHAQLGSLTTVIDSTHTLLCKQQSSLSVLLSRASSAMLGNAPWIQADVAWDAVHRHPDDNLMKIHHAFLVVQSTFLKHLAMTHYVPNNTAQRLYKNYNERIYWIHSAVLPHLTQEFKQNLESLERMYRLLKNSANQDNDIKKLGSAFIDNWLYSDIHTGVAKSCLEIKLTLNKCNSLDVFLDSCALNKQEIDLEVLNKDIDEIIDGLTKSLKTIQNSQLRLKKIQNKNDKEIVEEKEEVLDAGILKIEDRVPESKDEVFYFVRTDDDDAIQPAGDVTTAPGKKEMETSKIVFSELKRKLGKREDVMRERERQALSKTMPELKEIPEFPRQISIDEFMDRKGFIKKINKNTAKKKLVSVSHRNKKIIKDKKFKLRTAKYENESDISGVIFEANAKLNAKSKLLTVNSNNNLFITKWCKYVQSEKSSSYKDVESSYLSDSFSDYSINDNHKSASDNKKGLEITKSDLEMTFSSSDNDLVLFKDVSKDIRRQRVMRKKNHPSQKPVYGSKNKEAIDSDLEDESLKPMEYSFGTGMAMASVLQLSKKINLDEEMFSGAGELSTDSGNDADA